MCSGMEKEYFEQLLDAKFENLHQKIDTVIDLQKKTSDRVNTLEEDVSDIKIYRAEEQASWKVWSKLATVIGGMIGGLVGFLVNKLS